MIPGFLTRGVRRPGLLSIQHLHSFIALEVSSWRVDLLRHRWKRPGTRLILDAGMESLVPSLAIACCPGTLRLEATKPIRETDWREALKAVTIFVLVFLWASVRVNEGTSKSMRCACCSSWLLTVEDIGCPRSNFSSWLSSQAE